jgi:hypothetical protein
MKIQKSLKLLALTLIVSGITLTSIADIMVPAAPVMAMPAKAAPSARSQAMGICEEGVKSCYTQYKTSSVGIQACRSAFNKCLADVNKRYP